MFLDGVNFSLFFGLSLGFVPLSAGEPGVDALFNELILSDQEGALNFRWLFFFDVEIEGFLDFESFVMGLQVGRLELAFAPRGNDTEREVVIPDPALVELHDDSAN